MKCPYCDAIIQDDAVFCTNCGQKIPEMPVEPAPAAASAVNVPSDEDDALIGQISSFLAGKRERLATALKDNESLSAAYQNLDTRLSSIQASNMDLSSKMAALEKQIEDKDKELAAMQEELKQARQTISELEAKAAAAPAPAEPAPVEPVPAAAPVEPVPAVPVEPAPAAPVESAPAVESVEAEPVDIPAEPQDLEIPDNEADMIDEPTQSQVIGAYDAQDTIPQPPAAPSVQTCPNCGSAMPPENKFCTNCGTRLQ